ASIRRHASRRCLVRRRTVVGCWLRGKRLRGLGGTPLPGTLFPEPEFQTDTGRAAIVDFMPLSDGAHLVRIVMGRSGHVDFRNEFVARFDYGASVPWVSRLPDGSIDAIAGPERLILRAAAELYGEDLKTVGEFKVEAGQSVAFV